MHPSLQHSQVYKWLPKHLKQLPPSVAVGAVGVVLVGLLIPSGVHLGMGDPWDLWDLWDKHL